MGTLSGLISAYQDGGQGCVSEFAGILSPKYTSFVFLPIQSLWYFFLSSFGDVVCVLLQSFLLLYQVSVLRTSFLGLSGNLFKFRWSIFLCICFCYYSDSCHWKLTHLAWYAILFSPSDNVYVVWSLQFSNFLNLRGTSNLSSVFSDLLHDLKDRTWATTRTAKWADHFVVPVFSMGYFRKNIP